MTIQAISRKILDLTSVMFRLIEESCEILRLDCKTMRYGLKLSLRAK